MLDLKFIRENTDLVKKGSKDNRFTMDKGLLLASFSPRS
jgi:hypothetical protein